MAVSGCPRLGQRVFVHCRSTEFSRKTIQQACIVLVEDIATELEAEVETEVKTSISKASVEATIEIG